MGFGSLLPNANLTEIRLEWGGAGLISDILASHPNGVVILQNPG